MIEDIDNVEYRLKEPQQDNDDEVGVNAIETHQ
jgi:hypothetical protein